MAISTNTQQDLVNYLNENIDEKLLAHKAAKQFNISTPTVRKIAEMHNITIKKYTKAVPLTSQEQVLYNFLKTIANVRKSKGGEIRVQTKQGNFVPVTELMIA